MKYQVGDLINYNSGNLNRVGYITKVNKEFLCITFFHNKNTFFRDNDENIQEKMPYSFFELYYKVISKVKE